MLVPLKNMAGDQVGEIDLNDSIFAAPVRDDLMHQALMRQLSNARLGTHKVKTRGEVAGGGRKPWRQKGTGRARQGSVSAPNWVGGGTVFGPTPRKYTKRMPKKMHRAALRSALSAKARAGEVIVLDKLAMEQPKTKAMISALEALGVKSQSVLMVLADKNMSVQRSATNLPEVKTILSGYINVRDLLGHDVVMLSQDALEYVELWLGTDESTSFSAAVESEADESVQAETLVSVEDDPTDDDAADDTIADGEAEE